MGDYNLKLTGKRYGRLSVVKQGPNMGPHRAYECACDCGKTVYVRADSLRQGRTTSCGCAKNPAPLPNTPPQYHVSFYKVPDTNLGRGRAWMNHLFFLFDAELEPLGWGFWTIKPPRGNMKDPFIDRLSRHLGCHPALIAQERQNQHISHDGLNAMYENLHKTRASEEI